MHNNATPTVFVADDPNQKLLLPLKSSLRSCLKAICVAAKVVFSVPQSALTILGHPSDNNYTSTKQIMQTVVL